MAEQSILTSAETFAKIMAEAEKLRRMRAEGNFYKNHKDEELRNESAADRMGGCGE